MSLPPAVRLLAIIAAGIGIATGIMVWLVRKPRAAVTPEIVTIAEAKGAYAPQVTAAHAIILTPHQGAEPIDEEIRRVQQRILASQNPGVLLERLGSLFLAKARLSNDPGFYKLAELCAVSLESAQPGSHDAMLLRGHVFIAMHRFREAEAIAWRLVAAREFYLDHALLGDALMEQGRLDEAVDSYQRMVDLRPGLPAYTRIAHMRWLKGDLEGAGEMMEMAIESGTLREPEPVAWATVRLAAYRLQAGDIAAANQLSARALELVPDYAPALLMQGRILLAEGKTGEAVEPLQLAAERNPLPEYQWMLADTLRKAGEEARAAQVEHQLAVRGASSDPRTYSLFLATRRMRLPDALRLAEQELEERGDVFSLDALAWAQYANGRMEMARVNSRRALSEGTEDARLLLHAGLIAAASGDEPEARLLLKKTEALQQMLLPSERELLHREINSKAGSGVIFE